MKQPIYLVKYQGGEEWDDYYNTTIFATTDLSTAEKYVEKFNKLLNKWKEYYSQFEKDQGSFKWIKDEYIDTHFYTWNKLNQITDCYYEEIELR